ncbi:MAG: RING finger protein [Tepidiformaceae bacterium]
MWRREGWSSVHLQRFCPLCDRAFQEGEAVLRCEGCGVMHHPGCWVTNSGCVTQGEHKVTPIAQAYTTGRSISVPAPHPGEGARTQDPNTPGSAPRPLPTPARVEPPLLATEQWPVIGGAPVPARVQRQHPAEGFIPPHAPRRYVPPEGDPHAARKPLPKIYNSHGLLEYWYIPAALLVVAVVALGVHGGPGVGVAATATGPRTANGA